MLTIQTSLKVFDTNNIDGMKDQIPATSGNDEWGAFRTNEVCILRKAQEAGQGKFAQQA
jgi:hypothetical protein